MYVKNNLSNFPTSSSKHTYNTRSRTDLNTNHINYSMTQNSFVVVSIKLFNTLPNKIRELVSLAFKKIVKALLLESVYSVNEFLDVIKTHQF
jgi:hypothetical protein